MYMVRLGKAEFKQVILSKQEVNGKSNVVAIQTEAPLETSLHE
jgi:hypothetical protein